MKLTVACQICGQILAVVTKPQVTQDDINEYEENCSCDTVTNGVEDSQQNIQAMVTAE
jgi:hypothetical protein